jgi:hypothetical protein
LSQTVSGCANSSRSTHRVLMSCCSSFCRSDSVGVRGEVVPHRCAGQPLLEPEGSGKRSPAHREVVARGRGVQVRAPSGCRAVRIGYDGRPAARIQSRDDTQQLACRGPLPTTDARTDRLSCHPCGGTSFARHCAQPYRVSATDFEPSPPRRRPDRWLRSEGALAPDPRTHRWLRCEGALAPEPRTHRWLRCEGALAPEPRNPVTCAGR